MLSVRLSLAQMAQLRPLGRATTRDGRPPALSDVVRQVVATALQQQEIPLPALTHPAEALRTMQDLHQRGEPLTTPPQLLLLHLVVEAYDHTHRDAVDAPLVAPVVQASAGLGLAPPAG
jgi:hypothetical protein